MFCKREKVPVSNVNQQNDKSTQEYIRTLVAGLILHKIKEVEANSNPKGTYYECRTLAYIGIILTVLSLIIITFLHYRKSRL